MAKTVTLDEAISRLPRLLEEAAGGEEVVIENNGRPRARLVAMPPSATPAPDGPVPLGFWRGKVWMSDDFDAPWPEEIRRALEGEPDPDDPLDETTSR
jgi:antitoxin (DNA-binding transcriptional repressor) of toxin-antitoxin stability system